MATALQELDRSNRSELRDSRLGDRPVLRALSRAERPGIEILGQSAALQTVLTQLDLDQAIPPSLYKVVAELLAFVYRLNQSYQRPGSV